MIIVSQLKKHFGRNEVLKHVSMTMKKGSCIALVGPNGSGKTTLIKSILGMVLPDEGEIIFNGKKIGDECNYRSQIGYMPQMTRYPENMTIGQVIEMIRDIRNLNLDLLDEELIASYGLKAIYGKRMGTLSGGTRQKVGACLAFLFNPEVLILDEPTAGLDPISSEILKEKIICEKKKGKLILISSHVLSELDEMVNEVIYMQDGIVLFQKTVDLLKQETGETRLSKMISRAIK